MSELVQIRKKAQLTLPLSIRRKLGIEEGDYVDVRVKDGEVVLKLKKIIDKEQAWFWTDRWQAGEREVEEDYKAGRFSEFSDARSAITELHKKVKERKDGKKANR